MSCDYDVLCGMCRDVYCFVVMCVVVVWCVVACRGEMWCGVEEASILSTHSIYE